MADRLREAIKALEANLADLKSLALGGDATEDEPEIEEKMVGRGRKRRSSFGFKKKSDEAEDEDSSL